MTESRGSEGVADRIELEAPTDAEGERLDRYLARALDVPRNQIQQWIQEGRVLVADRTARPSHKLAAGSRVVCDRPVREQPDSMRPESGELEILHEDEHLVVIDKPAGLTVHPGAGQTGGTLANRLLHRYPETAAVGGPGRPGIVHRLDKDTTGVLAIARTERAYRELSRAFAEREVGKSYLAICYGDPNPPEGRIDLPIGRHPQRRVEMAVRRGGRPARTGFRRLANGEGISILELDLETGRTHQIRVHLKALGHPLVGDPVYGEARWKGLPKKAHRSVKSFSRPALHAWRIALSHPTTGDRVRVEAPVPEDLRVLWDTVTGTPFPV